MRHCKGSAVVNAQFQIFSTWKVLQTEPRMNRGKTLKSQAIKYCAELSVTVERQHNIMLLEVS